MAEQVEEIKPAGNSGSKRETQKAYDSKAESIVPSRGYGQAYSSAPIQDFSRFTREAQQPSIRSGLQGPGDMSENFQSGLWDSFNQARGRMTADQSGASGVSPQAAAAAPDGMASPQAAATQGADPGAQMQQPMQMMMQMMQMMTQVMTQMMSMMTQMMGQNGGNNGINPINNNNNKPIDNNNKPVDDKSPLQGDDKKTADFINKYLEKKGSPAAGKEAGEMMVKYGKQYGVDPMALLAIAGQETQWGKAGIGVNGMLGVGAYDSDPNNATRNKKFSGIENQIRLGAETFAKLRAKGGASAKDSLSRQFDAVNKAGWATDQNWHNGCSSIYDSILKMIKSGV
ncbi:MAG: hypothetical protein RDV48_24445 [Candidatus Eremiobacteraeota bacterium]|nr:hypothetical protein [Candidatus Eremiobacteraeota bacterium]